jgi:predicted ATPase
VILVIEGVNGTGKTTLVQHIVATRGFRWHKAFRAESELGSHWDAPEGQAKAAKLARLGIPVNTYLEDMFLADFYGRHANVNVVLDRSLPSAIAYRDIPDANIVEAMEVWKRTLGAHGKVAYLTLTADYAAVVSRVEPQRVPTVEQHTYVSESLEWAHILVDWPKHLIDTSARSVPSVRQEVLEFMDSAFS